MSFSESLTVRILGDSSELQRELDSVLNRFDDLKSKISETANTARLFSSSFSRLSQAIGPLQQVNQLISRVSQQLQSLSQRPISLNVGPALAALQRLSQAAQQTAAAIRAIPPIPTLGPGTGFPFPSGGNGFPPRRLASGGLVSGRSGIDRVPAQLTSGEYVINRSSVEVLGLGFLDKINASPTLMGRSTQPPGQIAARPAASVRNSPERMPAVMPAVMAAVPSLQTHQQGSPRRVPANIASRQQLRESMPQVSSTTSETNNNFGGITIQVTTPAESETLLRNLQLQGIGRRIRRG